MTSKELYDLILSQNYQLKPVFAGFIIHVRQPLCAD